MDLEKELTCSICTDLLYQPLTLLDCLHTFCGACLKEWFGWQALAAESRNAPPPRPGAAVFTCPSCRAAVRSTKHNATVATLLDMVLTTSPEKRKPADEQAEMDAKYRPGEDVLPKLHIPVRSAEQQRLDEAERRLIDEVREVSRQEAVAAAAAGSGGGAASHRSRSRSHVRQDSDSRAHASSHSGTHHHHRPQPHQSSTATREARQRQRLLTSADAAAAVADALEEDSRHPDERRHRRSTSSRQSTDVLSREDDVRTADSPSQRIMGHQSSLRLLISGSEPRRGAAAELSSATAGSTTESAASSAIVLDIEREIEEFARQIQEEGLLDGLDLDNIDPTNNDELSRKIAEAYDRRQRGRAAQQADSARRHRRNTSDVSRTSVSDGRHGEHGAATAATAADHSPRRPATLAVPPAGGRPPSASSRTSTSSRQRSRSQSSNESRLSATAQTTVAAETLEAAAPARASRPPSSTGVSTYLDVDDTARHHQRRRTASEGRTGAPRVHPSTGVASTQSQTDLPLRLQPAELPGGDIAWPVELPGSSAPAAPGTSRPSAPAISSVAPQAASYPLPKPPLPAELLSSTGSGGRAAAMSPTTASFQARAMAMGLDLQGQQAHQQQGQQRRQTIQQQQHSPQVATSQPPLATIATANLVQSPVAAERHGTAMFPSRTQQQQQQQQQAQESSHQRQHSRTILYPEPVIACARCDRTHIEYEVHYNCSVCSSGDWNICTDCFRRGRGCQHWFGFGYAAWHKWGKLAAAQAGGKNGAAALEKPHMLTANRYLPPRVVPGGAEGRRTLTGDNPLERLQSGVFCAGCQAWANSCYWRCDVCNEGDWGFCNDCVNQGRVCTHPLLPLTHEPVPEAEAAATGAEAPALPAKLVASSPSSLPAEPPRPHASALMAFQGDNASLANSSSSSNSSNAFRIGAFRALTFRTTCDHCGATIAPASARFHCYTCTSSVFPDTHAGDYDLCETCYTATLPGTGLLAAENGAAGWRRCPKAGHRMVVVAFRENTAGDSSKTTSGRVASIPRRVVLQDLVGGWRLEEEATATATTDGAAAETRMWYIWFGEQRLFPRPVARDVQRSANRSGAGEAVTAPAPVLSAVEAAAPPSIAAEFPPSGGVGAAAVARWAYYPEAGADDELAFPKHAEIREIEDVNGEWFHGVYMGRRGLFPGGYVHVVRG